MNLPVLICASANPDKVAEMRELLADVVDLRPRPEHVADVVEDADTLVGNARLKAAAIVAATGTAAVADDTGLEVDAFDGAPGVYTARYAGEGCSYADNRHKMLVELEGVADRRARFRTVALVLWPDGSEIAAEGVCTGSIATEERGTAGFGYDAIFVPDRDGEQRHDEERSPARAGHRGDDAPGLTFAEMSAGAKHEISHRGRAFRALLTELARR